MKRRRAAWSLLAGLLLAAPPAAAQGDEGRGDKSAIDAEHAFALAAQRGQWAAFRTFAGDSAIMLAPEKVEARTFLKDRREPAVPLVWWPRLSFTSCDGTLAVNTGSWLRAGDGAKGSFTTVWSKPAPVTEQPHGWAATSVPEWRWLFDHGRDTPQFVPVGKATSVDASCEGALGFVKLSDPFYKRMGEASPSIEKGGRAARALTPFVAPDLLVQLDDAMPRTGIAALPAFTPGSSIADYHSADYTLHALLYARKDGKPGDHLLQVWQWRGADKGFQLMLFELSGKP